MLKKLNEYFLKIVFSFMNEEQKLKLFKYNKTLQKIIERNLIHYKLFSQKYIIYESERKGKEYVGALDELIFEGEYLNGKRNGKGIEYDGNGNLRFEGEYLNGKRSGKGCEYSDGKLIFSGEYKNGEKNGKGKEYYLEGKLRFKGAYLNDKRIIGTLYDEEKNMIIIN